MDDSNEVVHGTPGAVDFSQDRPDDSLPLVLLVDDQPARLLTYESVLEGVGVTCVRALSGEEALGRLLKQSFALILLDVCMPGMDGFETARAIREHPRYEHTPIIFVTGVHLSELDSLRGYEVGAIDYIPVPVVPEILRSKVALLVELYKRRKQLERLNHSLAAARHELDQQRTRIDDLRPGREWLATLLDSLTEEVYFTDVNENYSYANPAALREFGYTSVEGSSVAALAARLEVLRADGTPRPLAEAPPLRSLRGEVVNAEEQRVRNPLTGELRTRQVSAAPVRDASGAIVGAVSVVRDVTEQRRNDDALRLRELRSRALLRLADSSRTITDPAELAQVGAQILGETLNVSRCGYGTIDPLAETMTVERDWNAPGVSSLAGTLSFREYGSYIDNLKRGETVVCPDARLDPRTQATADRLEGIAARAFVNLPVIEDGAFVALLYLNNASVREWTEEELAFVRDVAERTRIAVERRRYEQALAADLAITTLLRDLATREVSGDQEDELFDDIVAAAIAIAGADGGTLRLLDEGPHELRIAAARGLDADFIAHFSRVNAQSRSPCGVALASGQRSLVAYDEPGADDPDGTLRLHRQRGLHSGQSTPLTSRAGRPLGMISTHWRERPKITDRELRYLDLLARQTADLIERNHAAQALRVSAEQLRDADRRKDEFIAMLAHELRNPLVPIRSAIELLKKSDGPSTVVGMVRPMMERQVKHIVRLIDDLLDVSRITSGRIELRREAVQLGTLIESATESNRELLTQGALTLTLNVSNAEQVLNVDATRFTQVLSNLLHNAIKFTPAGGQIMLGTSVESVAPDAHWLSLSVADTGVGISAEQLPRIFDLFGQASGAGRTPNTGLGIGLALARRLMQMHGGTLEASSPGQDQGSTFVLRISIDAPLTPHVPAPAEADVLLTGVQVLVVDDTRDTADVIQMLVESAGALARVAYDGTTALALAAQAAPDVIVLDLGMPIMDGYDTCRALRALLGDTVGIIALTGWGREDVKQKVLQTGFDAHLTKPADPDELAQLILKVRRTPVRQDG